MKIVMKNVLPVILCAFIGLSMSACKRGDTESESATSSDIGRGEPSLTSEGHSTTSSAITGNTKASSTKNTTSDPGNSSHTTEGQRTKASATATESAHSQQSSYEDIVCHEILDFQQVGFSVNNSNVMMHMTMPKEWTLEKDKNGYNIVKKSQTIGRVTASERTGAADGSVNLFLGELTVGDMKVTHSIDRVNSDEKASYTRTLCYYYDAEFGSSKNISITVSYQEIDASAVVTMMTEAKKSISFTEKNMGVLQIQDNRNRILILGNSFVSTSDIGSTLQAMCGSNVSVEAYSRGYASVKTYTQDTHMMQNIRAGRYSTVFMCGVYTYSDVVELEDIVHACEASNTKMAIFPAHNENRSNIDKAAVMYPSVALIDWKAEIDALISTGVDDSHFCIADSHKHSTPLAGYVGAHMIYRAVFNKMPQTTSFGQVSKSQIALLGDYATSGSIVLLDGSSAYVIG